MEPNSGNSIGEQTAHAIGEIKGLLNGLSQMISANAESLNRRIDDMHQSNTRRLDDISANVTRRMDEQSGRLDTVAETARSALAKANAATDRIDANHRTAAKTSGGVGAIGGGVAVAAIELIKAALQRF